MNIRCICHNISVEEIVKIAKERGLTVAQLQEQNICATKCEMCVPYIEKELKK